MQEHYWSGGEEPSNLFFSFEPLTTVNLSDLNIDMYYAMQIFKVYLDAIEKFKHYFPIIQEVGKIENEDKFEFVSSTLEERVRKLSSIYNPSEWIFIQPVTLCPARNSPLEKEVKLAQRVGIEDRDLYLVGFSTLDFLGCKYDRKIELERRKEYSKRFRNIECFDPFKDLKL